MEGKSQRSKAINYHITTYTREQKIVAAVWYHERLFTGMSYEQLKQNFLVRFKTEYPKYSTLKKWEQQLFRDGFLREKANKAKYRTTLTRLMHVPYVKESLIRYPDLTMRGRANLLGMSVHTLFAVFKNDLKESDLVNITKSNIQNNSVDDSKLKEDIDNSKLEKDIDDSKLEADIKIETETVYIKQDPN